MKKTGIILLTSSLLFVTGCTNNLSSDSDLEKEKAPVSQEKEEVKKEDSKKEEAVKKEEGKAEDKKKDESNKEEDASVAISKIYEAVGDKSAKYIWMSPDDSYVHNESKAFKAKYYVFSELHGDAISDCNYLVDKNTYEVFIYLPDGNFEKIG